MKESWRSDAGQIYRLKELKVSIRTQQAIQDLINCQLKKYTILKPSVILKNIKGRESAKVSNIFI